MCQKRQKILSVCNFTVINNRSTANTNTEINHKDQIEVYILRSNDTYPIGITSRRINFSLSRAMYSSRKPIQIHVIALVGRIAHANAATARAHFLEPGDILLADVLMQGQQYRLTTVRTVSRLLDKVRVIQKNMNQFVNWTKSCR